MPKVSPDPEQSRAAFYNAYLQLAHELCKGMTHIPCGTFGGPEHHPLEERIARELVAAFHRGKRAGGRR